MFPVAASPDDFTAPSPLLQAVAGAFGPGRPLCFDIPILDDDSVELEECFIIAISLPPLSDDLVVSITDEEDTTLCCIQDDDSELIKLPLKKVVSVIDFSLGVTVGFEQTLYLTQEGFTIEVCVRILDGSVERDVVVEVSSSDGTASG